MPVIGCDEVAEAAKCTGDPTVELTVGDVTVTPAKAAPAKARMTHNKRTQLFKELSLYIVL
jgi:hypothetical protein